MSKSITAKEITLALVLGLHEDHKQTVDKLIEGIKHEEQLKWQLLRLRLGLPEEEINNEQV